MNDRASPSQYGRRLETATEAPDAIIQPNPANVEPELTAAVRGRADAAFEALRRWRPSRRHSRPMGAYMHPASDLGCHGRLARAAAFALAGPAAIAFAFAFLAFSAVGPCAFELRMRRQAIGFQMAMTFTAPALPGVSCVR